MKAKEPIQIRRVDREPLMCLPLPLLIVLNLVMTLNFDLLTSKPDQFKLGLKYAKVVIYR